jgi:thymidylate synthase
MLFFRDNNKMKNELLEEKKSFETLLWQLKEGEKNLLKKEKNLTKIYKKEQKSRNSEQVDKLSQAMEELAN